MGELVLDRSKEDEANQSRSNDEASRQKLKEELEQIRRTTEAEVYAQYNVGGAAIQETRVADERIKLGDTIRNRTEMAVALMAFQRNEPLDKMPEGLGSYMQQHGEKSLPDLLAEIAELQAKMDADDPRVIEFETTRTAKELRDTREELVMLQYAEGKGQSKEEFTNELKQATDKYTEAFVTHLLEVFKVDPKEAIKRGQELPQIIEKIQLGLSSPQSISEAEMFGSFGFVMLDALAREEVARAELLEAIREHKPTKLVDKLKNSKALKAITATAFIAGTTFVAAKSFLPENFSGASDVIDNGFKYLGVYVVSRTGLKGLRDRLENFSERRKAKKSISALSESRETAEQGLRSIYGNVEYDVELRQAKTDDKKGNESKFHDVDWHFRSNLKEFVPGGIPYTAEAAIQYAKRIVVDNGDQLRDMLSKENGQELIFAGLAEKLLVEDIKSHREKIKENRRVNAMIHLTSVLSAFAGRDIIKTVNDIKGALGKSQTFLNLHKA